MKEDGFQEGEAEQAESLPSRNERKHKRVSVRKSSLGGSGESWFHSKSGQN